MKRKAAPTVLAALLLWPNMVWARAASEVHYTVRDIYMVAVRFVRVDRGCNISDKDAESAFVTFRCTESERTKQGSLEIIRLGENRSARLQVSLPDDPHYTELRFLELFERKLREELGTPVDESRAPARTNPDAGSK